MRLISLCPSNTEILFALGLGHCLVGVDNSSDWPPQRLDHLPRLGPDLAIDIDRVCALKPDLVIASLSVPGMERVVEGLRRAGLPHIVLNPQDLADISRDIRLVGEATGRTREAKAVARRFEETLAWYRQRAATASRRWRLYWEWWPKPVYTPGRRNWLTNVSELVGGENVFADFDTDNVQTDWDTVAARDPDAVCVVWCGVDERRIHPERITGRPGWARLAAVQHGRVYILPEGKFCRPSPRLLEGLYELAKRLRTEWLADGDPPLTAWPAS